MIPEVSKLNWSTQKPTFEEVEGKAVLVKSYCAGGGGIWVDAFSKLNIDQYNGSFCGHYMGYAILDTTPPDPEPLPLWGVMPQVNISLDGSWSVYADRTDEKQRVLDTLIVRRPTRAEAIAEWNKIAERLNELSL